MPPKIDFTVNTSVLDAILRNLNSNVAQAVAKTAFNVETLAKLKAPVDTGALRASIYTSLKGAVNFALVDAEVHSRRPEAITGPLPRPMDTNTAYVGPSVSYGAVVELGGSTHGGRPYLQPAVRESEHFFREAIAAAVKNGK